MMTGGFVRTKNMRNKALLRNCIAMQPREEKNMASQRKPR